MHGLGCPLCGKPSLLESSLSRVVADAYPVSEGHVLVVPKRCVPPSALTFEEVADMAVLAARSATPPCNIGMNCGRDAGQTVTHAHIHVIPRVAGDVEDPTGGVRGVIPKKRVYGKVTP